MKYTVEEFFNVAMKRLPAIKKLIDELAEGAREGHLVSNMTEHFAGFVKAFDDDEKEVAYAIIFMVGVHLGASRKLSVLYENEGIVGVFGGKKKN